MICLTGDIHHTSSRTNDQVYLSKIHTGESGMDTEVKISNKFLELAAEYGLKITFYITGLTLKEEWDDFKDIARSPLVELGGHTYSGIPLSGCEKIKYMLKGIKPPSHKSNYGSIKYQKKDISRTLKIIKDKTGQEVVSWRSHGYVHDENTYKLLNLFGVKFISDEISSNNIKPYRIKEGLISHPINAIPDHDHIFHAHRDKAFCNSAKLRGYGADIFGCENYYAEEWGELVRKQV
ncbi:MAG: hypothetical protein FJW66_08315, partial [Actinobacteria bacterium]|nr:hypothetical protein [Actinomycetota bacterium]